MIRILLEQSLPRRSLPSLQAALHDLGDGVRSRAEPIDSGPGCESLVRGGEAEWTPCSISLEVLPPAEARLPEVLGRVKELLCEAARLGDLELLQIPVNAQVGDEYLRFRDLLEVARHAGRR